jgi:glycosyltransferase involved in cell wall biosynthesis
MKVFIYTPSNGGMVNSDYAVSLAATVADLVQHGIEPRLIIDKLCCSLPKSRNGACAYVLNNPDIDYLMFIDADMSWDDPTALRKMIMSNHNIVLGAYISRGEKKFWTMRRIEGEVTDSQGFLKVFTGPSGFLLIHRTVLEAVSHQRPELKINLNDDVDSPAPGEYFFFREVRSESGRSMTSDDYGFFETVRQCGLTIWCYTNITFDHYWMTSNRCNLKEQLEREL